MEEAKEVFKGHEEQTNEIFAELFAGGEDEKDITDEDIRKKFEEKEIKISSDAAFALAKRYLKKNKKDKIKLSIATIKEATASPTESKETKDKTI